MRKKLVRSPAELRDRLAQRGSAVLERLGFLPRGDLPAGADVLPVLPFPRPTREEVLKAFAKAPGDRPNLLERADRLHAGRFDLLGYNGLDFGTPVDWHSDPVHQRRAPLVHWSMVPYLDPDVVGDHKVIWELNRHSFLVTLAQAWTVTGDPRHPALFAHLVDSWLDGNPPTLGINWVSSLELAFRAIAWTWALHLFGTEIPTTLRERMARSLDLHGRHIERHLSTWFSPNTHLTGEALGLLYLGTAWPGFRRAERWRQRGWRVLLEQLPRQVRSDGTYFEQSTWYQGYTVDFYLHALQLADASGSAVPSEARERVVMATQVLAALVRPDGTIPLFGDDDGGRLLPLGPFPPTRFGDTLAHAENVLAMPGLTHGVYVPPESVWLTGAMAESLGNTPKPDPGRMSIGFRGGGWFVGRTQRLQLALDAGPHGALTGAHAHADALSLDLALDGQPLLADPGSRSYIGMERGLFRSTGWHSTLTFPGLSSAEAAGPFRWNTFPETTVTAWETGDGYAWFDGWHDGWSRVASGLRHRRSILLLDGLGLIVLDRLTGAPPEDLPSAEIRWHAAAGIQATLTGETATLSREDRVVATMTSDMPDRVMLEPGRTSSCYGSEHGSVFVVVRPGQERLRSGTAAAVLPGHHNGVCIRSEGEGRDREWTLRMGTLEAVIRQPRSGIAWRVIAGSLPRLVDRLELSTSEPW